MKNYNPIATLFGALFTKLSLTEVYINNQRVYTLVDTGASKSVMSLKISQTEKMESLQLVFKSNTRIMRMTIEMKLKHMDN